MNNTKWNFIASNVQCLQITIEEIERKYLTMILIIFQATFLKNIKTSKKATKNGIADVD